MFILPIEYIFDVFCGFIYKIFFVEAMALVCLSLFVNVITQPLYRRAEKIQSAEFRKRKSMEVWEKHIRSSFSGDERRMMLARYYKTVGYDPVAGAFNTLIPLLLQIPFFIAAYHFISGSELISNAEIPFVGELALQDGLLRISNIRINALPVIMTMINLISAYIYLKDAPKREKIQSVLIAVVFMILLYRSPAGLLVYWILNNLYSLTRNIIDRYVPDKRRLYTLFSLLPLFFYFIYQRLLLEDKSWLMSHGAFGCILLVFSLIGIVYPIIKHKTGIKISIKALYHKEYILAVLIILLLLGGVIPSFVIASSPQDFVNIYHFENPLGYIINTFVTYLGCSIWCGVIYIISENKTRKELCMIVPVIAILLIVQYVFYGHDYGLINTELVYDELLISSRKMIINILVSVAVIIIVVLCRKYFRKLFSAALIVAAVTLTMVLMINIVRIKSMITDEVIPLVEGNKAESEKSIIEGKPICLSRENQNVIVMMLDRAIGSYIPYFLAEKPELADKFAGFTWYPDTLSFGWKTDVASPALFGGYDYVPEKINERSDVLLSEKHNEALHVMPLNFSQNGYRVALFDLPFAGYQWIPDMRVFDDCDNTEAFVLQGCFTPDDSYQLGGEDNGIRQQKFFLYSLFRSIPLIYAKELYDNGEYLHRDETQENSYDEFIDSWYVLKNLSEITQIDDERGSFIMINNNTTHAPCYVRLPDYIPGTTEDNYSYEALTPRSVDGRQIQLVTRGQKQHYQVNMAAMIQIGDYLDFLRKEGLYDNTRIIIVADHGIALSQFEDLLYYGNSLDIQNYNPLLMVKDFDSQIFSVSYEFMTNADTPMLAMQGVIERPVNPYTGDELSDSAKQGELHVCTSEFVGPDNTRTVLPSLGAPWYTVRGSIFKEQNWNVWQEAPAEW